MNHLITLLIVILCVHRVSAMENSAAAAPRPNVLIIFTDDQGYGDLGCYGLKTAKTPHLDRLAAEGTRFTSFYTQPVCGPARSALLSGRYPARSGGWQMPATEITFASLMQKSGYATACIGKWDVSARKEIVDRMPNARGFDYYWGPLGANDKGRVELWENNTALGEDKDIASLSRRYTDKSTAWLREQTKNQEPGARKPFLLYLAHTMMHTVIDASPAFRDKSGHGLYADTLQELDHECGRLLAALDDLGLRENTLVIFTTDNGPWSNDAKRQHAVQEGGLYNPTAIPWSKGPEIAWGDAGPLREGKASSYEGGVRVPCLVRWPGKVPAGRVNDAIFATLDFMPTFATLAGFTAPQDRVLDGFDQTDLLLGKSETGPRDHYFYHDGRHGVRQGPWKLLRGNRYPKNFDNTYPQERGGSAPELYNLDADIGEKTNLAAQHPDIVARLSALKLPEEKSTAPKGEAAPAKGKGKAKAKTAAVPQATPTLPARVVDLQCEGKTSPLAVDAPAPRLSWRMEDARRGAAQAGYQIIAASSREKLTPATADLWNTRRVKSAQSTHLAYAGKAPASRQRVWWQVRVWDEAGRPSAWSEPAFWDAGILATADWRGQWIESGPLPAVRDAVTEHWAHRATLLRRKEGERESMLELFRAVAPAPRFRRTFTLAEVPQSARIAISGLGNYVLFINGRRVGDHENDPGRSDYRTTAFYSTYDVAAHLRAGENVIAVQLAHGWYDQTIAYAELSKTSFGKPMLIAELSATDAAGKQTVIGTDAAWKFATGPLVKEAYWYGEAYDARRAQPGWDAPGYDDASWQPARLVTSGAPPALRAMPYAPERVVETLQPVKIAEPFPGVFVFDFGRIVSGRTRLRLKNIPEGTTLTLRSADWTHLADRAGRGYEAPLDQPDVNGWKGRMLPDYGPINAQDPAGRAGMISYNNCMVPVLQGGGGAGGRQPKFTGGIPADVYHASAAPEQTWTRQFGWNLARYVELTGFPGRPDADTLALEVVHTDAPPAGRFECADELLNRINTAVDYTARQLLHGHLLDRNGERAMYPGQAAHAAPAVLFHRAAADVWTHLCDLQATSDLTPAGLPRLSTYGKVIVAGPAPIGPGRPYNFPGIKLAWQTFLHTGDRALIERWHPLAMKVLRHHFERGGRIVVPVFTQPTTEDYPELILDGNEAGPLGGVVTQRGLVTLAHCHEAAAAVHHAAVLLGKKDDVAWLERLLAETQRAFIARHFDAEKNTFGSQTGDAFALNLRLYPDGKKDAILRSLVARTEGERRGHFGTGLFGSPALLEALSENGHIALAHRLMTQRDFPSYAHQLDYPGGFANLWEGWGSITAQGRPLFDNCPQAHGLIQVEPLQMGVWFFEQLAGLRPDPAQGGFQHFHLAPKLPPALAHAAAEHTTPHGLIRSQWRRDGAHITWRVTVPPNTTATATLPASTLDGITESAKPLAQTPGLTVLDATAKTVRLTAGDYTFTIPAQP